jgi:hypothetical protein
MHSILQINPFLLDLFILLHPTPTSSCILTRPYSGTSDGFLSLGGSGSGAIYYQSMVRGPSSPRPSKTGTVVVIHEDGGRINNIA